MKRIEHSGQTGYDPRSRSALRRRLADGASTVNMSSLVVASVDVSGDVAAAASASVVALAVLEAGAGEAVGATEAAEAVGTALDAKGSSVGGGSVLHVFTCSLRRWREGKKAL